MLAGGKFANGAITGAFAQLYNAEATLYRAAGQAAAQKIAVTAGTAATLAVLDGPSPILDLVGAGWLVYDSLGAVAGIFYSDDGGSSKPDGIPDNWIETESDKGGGKIYQNPNDPQDRIRVMPGNPASSFPAQKDPYVVDQIDGKFLTGDGRRVQGGSRPEVHIPRKDYDFTKR